MENQQTNESGMKYRRLRLDELKELENEFITFLSSNTVTGSDWEKLKVDQPQKADQLIDMFSDIVFEKILGQVQYLEFKTPKDYKTFHFTDDQIIMLGVQVAPDAPVDFTQNISPEQMSGQMILSGSKMKMYRGEKKYRKERNLEIFDLMEQGALISKDGKMYKTLEQLGE